MTAPTELDALDGVNAMAYVEFQRQEAISTLTRIAHGYDQAVVAMDQGVPPSYPPPANIYEVPIGHKPRRLRRTRSERGAGSRTSAGSTTRGTAGGTTGRGKAAVLVRPIRLRTRKPLPQRLGGTPVASPLSGVDLAGNGTLHADQTGPLTTAGPTPTTNMPGDPGKYGPPTGLPPMGGSLGTPGQQARPSW
ncbi:hypothetical protein ACU686_39655 [Yinghuangia aomiensis]